MATYRNAAEMRRAQASAAEGFTDRLATELGVDPDALLAEYRASVDRVQEASVAVARIKGDLARLAAEHGTRGQTSHWEHNRKALLCRLMETRRSELLAAGEKVVEKALDNEAHAHHDYLAFLDKGRRELEEYEHRQADLSEAFAALEHARGVQAYLSARLEMFRALSFAWGQEARLTA